MKLIVVGSELSIAFPYHDCNVVLLTMALKTGNKSKLNEKKSRKSRL